ncbi:hypothetical protein ITI46_24395 [Streptomyces oryzae]|uniref:Uncharacterized protein n=1 Tax=Streptomyces oryzae TaxID=1434886 RepID=A0ABS3XHB3_9ACTN|nr:hypothetical protein [Streptomyces oryzae]MBO8194771.1 hypothetical protein [Streptomyces oryzae]
MLLYVTGPDVPGAAHGACAGLLGRALPDHDPGTTVGGLPEANRVGQDRHGSAKLRPTAEVVWIRALPSWIEAKTKP